MGLILDSSVVIAAERRRETVEQLIQSIVITFGDQPAALSAVGLTALVHGIYRAPNAEIRIRRQTFLNDLLVDCAVYPHAQECALLAGRLDAEQRNRGVIIPFPDLLIGATALSLGFSVLTVNVRHFERIPALKMSTF
jgi:tRNA(fMet)-specific endonuclease VapC